MFDIAGARQAGYSDDEIAGFLASQAGFDLDAATKAGYTSAEVVGFLSETQESRPDPGDPLTRVTPTGGGSTFTVSPIKPSSVLDTPTDGLFDPQAAQRLSSRQAADASVDPRTVAPVAKPSSQRARDPNVGRGEALADSSLPVRAAAKVATGGAQGIGGVVRAIGDVTGAQSVADFGGAAARGARAFEEGMGKSGPVEGFGPKSPLPYLRDMAEGAASSLGQSALYGGAMGARAVIPALSIQTAGQEYDQARAAGLEPAAALAGAIPKGAFEAVGEKFARLDKAVGAIGTLLTKGATAEAKRSAGQALLASGIREIPGEVVTYLGQTATDLIPGIGLNPNLTMSQFLDGLRDTVVQAGMMGGAMGGGGALLTENGKPAPRPQTAAEMARARGFLVGEAKPAPAAADPADPAALAPIATAPNIDAAIAAAEEAVAAVDAIGRILGQGDPNASQPSAIPGLPAGVGGIGSLDADPGMAAGTGVDPLAAPAMDASGDAGPAAAVAASVGAPGPQAVTDVGGYTLNPSGTLSVQGDTKALRQMFKSAGIENLIARTDGVLVGRSQAQQAMQVLQDFQAGAQPLALPQVPQTAPVAAPAVESDSTAAQPVPPENSRGEPANVWFGRRGDGYQTVPDAEAAMVTRQRVQPDLQWQVEQMANGRYRLAGYTPEAQGAAEPAAQNLSSPAQIATVEPAPVETLGATGNPAAGGREARARAYAANPLRAFIGKHGLSPSLTSEFAPGPRERRSAMVQGYGPIFRATGKQIDELAQAAVEEGFLTSPDADELYRLIARVFSGERIIPQYAEGVVEQEMERARAEEMDEDAAVQEEAAADEAAEREAIAAVAALADNELFELDDAPALGAAGNASTEDAMRALGFTDEEIRDATAEATRGPQADGARGEGPDATAAAETPRVDRGGEAQARPARAEPVADESQMPPSPEGAFTKEDAKRRLVDARKRASVLESLRACMGA